MSIGNFLIHVDIFYAGIIVVIILAIIVCYVFGFVFSMPSIGTTTYPDLGHFVKNYNQYFWSGLWSSISWPYLFFKYNQKETSQNDIENNVKQGRSTFAYGVGIAFGIMFWLGLTVLGACKMVDVEEEEDEEQANAQGYTLNEKKPEGCDED